jgi:hypothetical protein
MRRLLRKGGSSKWACLAVAGATSGFHCVSDLLLKQFTGRDALGQLTTAPRLPESLAEPEDIVLGPVPREPDLPPGRKVECQEGHLY